MMRSARSPSPASAFPPLHLGFAGFFSKDVIIEAAYAAGSQRSRCFAFGVLVARPACSRGFYFNGRLMFMTFMRTMLTASHARTPTRSCTTCTNRRTVPWVMLVPLVVLSLGAIFAGFVFVDYFVGEEYAEFWKGAIFTLRPTTSSTRRTKWPSG
jgi:NADH-quinone oxidoreductase subunit L